MTNDEFSRDPMALLRKSDPVKGLPRVEGPAAASLLDRAQAASTTPPRPHRRSAAFMGSLAAAVLMGGAGAAYAAFWQSAETALQIECAVGVAQADFERTGSGGGILSTASGNPVQDCAAEYRRLAGQVPDLRACTHGRSFITVVPAAWKVPDTWQPLDSSFRNDPSRVELESRLADQIEGPEASCLDADAAEEHVRRDLADLGLAGWSVERLEQAQRADGTSWCAEAFLDWTGRNAVLIQGLQEETVVPGTTNTVDGITGRLRSDIVEQCLSLPAASTAAERAVADAGASVADAEITTLEDAKAQCTRVDFVPAGLISIVLRGPAA